MMNQENSNMGSMPNDPMNQSMMPDMMQAYPQEVVQPVMEDAMTYQAVYPEIYYKLKPYITMTGDLIVSSGSAFPTQQQLEDISDNIFEDFCKMNPDMEDYMKKSDMNDPADDPPIAFGGFRSPFRRRFRRRGLGRDLIFALLLSDLLGRSRF